jgi:hypothetical protein
MHPGEGRYCGEAQAEAIALKGLDIMDTQTLLIIIVLVLLLGGGGWRPGPLVLGRQAGCPSRIMLEFNDVAPGLWVHGPHARNFIRPRIFTNNPIVCLLTRQNASSRASVTFL